MSKDLLLSFIDRYSQEMQKTKAPRGCIGFSIEICASISQSISHEDLHARPTDMPFAWCNKNRLATAQRLQVHIPAQHKLPNPPERLSREKDKPDDKALQFLRATMVV